MNKNKNIITNKHKLINYSNFMLVNLIIVWLISYYYLSSPFEQTANNIEIFYLVASHISYVFFLWLIVVTCCLPLVYFAPIIIPSITSIALFVFSLDAIIYRDLKLHANIVDIKMIIGKTGSLISSVTIITLASILAISIIQHCLWYYTNRGQTKLKTFHWQLVASCLLITIISYQFIPTITKKQLTSYYVTADTNLQPMLQLPKKITSLLNNKQTTANYPLNAMQYQTVSQPKNIVFIGIDAWRADCCNPQLTPNIYKYCKKAVQFNNHISAGNHTRDGLFGLFYAIAPINRMLFTAKEKSPVFIDRLQQLNYQTGIFFSANLCGIEADKNIFRNIDNLRLGSTATTAATRDLEATTDWLQWYEKRNKEQPHFSFIFYDSVHEYDFLQSFAPELQPQFGELRYHEIAEKYGQEYMNTIYKTSVSYTDSLIAKILAKLQDEGELENTLIVITGDHGHELNDYQQQSWGHSNNLTPAVIKVPLLVMDEKFSNTLAAEYNTLTSHYDIVATIMKNYLGATNNVTDYTDGIDLLANNNQRDWVVATGRKKYLNYFGIIKQDYSIKLLHSGFYQVHDNSNTIISNAKLNYTEINEAFNIVSRFFSIN